MIPEHEVPGSCEGERCSVCGEPATHKLAEEPLHEYPLTEVLSPLEVDRYALMGCSAYVCCIHFARALGQVQCKLRDPDSEQTDDFWVSQTLEIVRQMANGSILLVNNDFKIGMADDMTIGYMITDGDDTNPRIATFDGIRLSVLYHWVKKFKMIVVPK